MISRGKLTRLYEYSFRRQRVSFDAKTPVQAHRSSSSPWPSEDLLLWCILMIVPSLGVRATGIPVFPRDLPYLRFSLSSITWIPRRISCRVVTGKKRFRSSMCIRDIPCQLVPRQADRCCSQISNGFTTTRRDCADIYNIDWRIIGMTSCYMISLTNFDRRCTERWSAI